MPAKEPKTAKSKPIIFKCRVCEQEKSLDEMVVLTTYFPPVVMCQECEKKAG